MKENLIGNRQVRIFISSTFQDMQDERDHLMKRTFPKLREAAMKRDVILTELDLRWGITEEESRTGKVVDICLKEIENSVPFFIGIVGDRYGWVPQDGDLSAGVIERFPPVKDYLERHLSVTEMEMQFGVLNRDEDMHAFFYIKDGLNEGRCQDNPEMLERLKTAIRESRYPHSTYSSAEDLAAQVESSFLAMLDELFPEAEVSEHQNERRVQQSFINKLSFSYVRDRENFDRIDGFISDDSSRTFVITGESGLGKSALIANWAKEHMDDGRFCLIPYFCSNGGNQSHTNILRYVCEEISERLGVEPPGGDESDRLGRIFESIATLQKKVVIILDAVNQIADISQAKMLNWLPYPPKNVKIIFSTLPDDSTMKIFRNRCYPVFELRKLDAVQRASLVTEYLNRFGKRLTPAQIGRITTDEQCGNTLVLRTVLEELISYGDYGTLDSRIDFYLHGDSVSGFYGKVLSRFEEDFGAPLVREVLGLIAVSRNGLSEDAIMNAAGIKRLEWSEFFCSFSAHLNNQSGRYVFTHSYITETVWNRYLRGDKAFEQGCRRKVVEELAGERSIHAMNEVPFQLDMIGDWDRLHDYIIDFSYMTYATEKDIIETGTFWRHILDSCPGKYSPMDALEAVSSPADRVHLFMALISLGRFLCDDSLTATVASMFKELIATHPEYETAGVYRSLATCCEDRYQGIELAKKSLMICKESGDVKGELETYGVMSGIYYHMTVVYHDPDSSALAAQVQERMLQLGTKYYGEVHPFVMTAYQEKTLNCDDDDQALLYGLKSIELGSAIYGEEHPNVGRPYHYTGCIYREKKDWENALKYFKRAYEVWIPAYGINHEIMISSLGNQAKCLINLGNPREALKDYDRCLDIMKNISDENGYGYAVTQLNRSRILQQLGLHDEAVLACMEAEKTLLSDRIRNEGRSKQTLEVCRSYMEKLRQEDGHSPRG